MCLAWKFARGNETHGLLSKGACGELEATTAALKIEGSLSTSSSLYDIWRPCKTRLSEDAMIAGETWHRRILNWEGRFVFYETFEYAKYQRHVFRGPPP